VEPGSLRADDGHVVGCGARHVQQRRWFGPFHFMALVRAVTLAGGLAPYWLGRRTPETIRSHAYFMVWSYVGPVAAGLSQFANRTLPDHGFPPVLAASAVTVGIAAVVINRWIPKEIGRALAD
jgi:hypothetical protein